MVQDESFDKLLDDIKNNRPEKGMSKKAIISKYGNPVICKEDGKGSGIEESCLYRHVLEYFPHDAAYLYFDRDQKLYYWELEKRK